MTALDEFYASYLHYTVAQRLFEDTCRQLLAFKGGLDERQAMVDETLRLSMCVCDNIDETEGLMADTIEYIQSEGGDDDLLEAMSLIANNLKEDRARANSYGNHIMARRLGNAPRKPRRPQVANPFVPLAEEADPVETLVIPPAEVQPDPEPIVEEEPEGGSQEDGISEGPDDEESPCDPDEESSEEPTAEAEEVSASEGLTEEPSDEGAEGDDGRNPLVEESEMIMQGGSPEEETTEEPDKPRRGGLLRRRRRFK